MKRWSKDEIQLVYDLIRNGVDLAQIKKKIYEKFGISRPISTIKIIISRQFLSDIGCKVNVSSGFYTLSLTCSVCGRIFDIRTTNLKVYTREVVKTWKCLVCNEREKS